MYAVSTYPPRQRGLAIEVRYQGRILTFTIGTMNWVISRLGLHFRWDDILCRWYHKFLTDKSMTWLVSSRPPKLWAWSSDKRLIDTFLTIKSLAAWIKDNNEEAKTKAMAAIMESLVTEVGVHWKAWWPRWVFNRAHDCYIPLPSRLFRKRWSPNLRLNWSGDRMVGYRQHQLELW